MADSEGSPSEERETAAFTRRGLIGAAGLSGLSLLAGCGGFNTSSDTGIDVYQNGTSVTEGVSRIDFSGLTTVEKTDSETVAIKTAIQDNDISGIDAKLGSVTADSLHIDTNRQVTFGDNNEVSATFDQDTQRLMLYGNVEIS